MGLGRHAASAPSACISHGIGAPASASSSRSTAASRVAIYILPAAAVCWSLSPDREACACLAVLLTGSVVWLRWRSRRSWEATTTGLLAGAVPLAVGVLLSPIRPACGGAACVLMSAAAGLAAGVWIAKRQQCMTSPASSWIAAAAVAALAGSLGCLPLGLFGIAGVVGGVIVGSGLGAVLSLGPR